MKMKKSIVSILLASVMVSSAFMPVQAAVSTSKDKQKIVAINDKVKFSEDSVVVTMDKKSYTSDKIKQYFSNLALESVTPVEKDAVNSNAFILKLKKKSCKNVLQAIDIIKSKPGVLYAEPSYYLNTYATVPNDPMYEYQVLKNMGAEEAWDITQGSPDITIGVIDTGISPGNPDIYPNLWTNTKEIPNNNIDDDRNGYIDDYHGYNFVDNSSNYEDSDEHGTLVAGIIAAKGNNYKQVAGVTWNCKVAGLRIISPPWHTAVMEDLIEAVKYATKMKFPILNISMGTYGYSQALYDAIKAYPGLVVAAAGNYSSDNDRVPLYPASFDLDNIISVAATQGYDVLSPNSDYGKTSVDLVAPGYLGITSTGLTYDSYGSGTSMSAPMVSGTAALLLSYKPDYTTADLKKAILDSVDVVPGLENYVATSGKLNIYKALIQVLPDNAAPAATELTVENSSGSHAPWEAGLNLQGENCLNSYQGLVCLNGVKDRSGVQGVRFHAIGYTNHLVSTQDYVFTGTSDGEGNWYTYLNFKKIPRADYYRIQAFPVDSKGNSLESTMLWNYNYKWEKIVKYDKVMPTGSVNIWGTNGNWNTATYDGNPVTNGTGVSVRAGASEAWYSGSGIKSVECHLFKNNTIVQSKNAVNYSPDAIGNGTYETSFDYSSLVGQGQKVSFIVRTIIYDYANNDTVIDNYFTYDPLSR